MDQSKKINSIGILKDKIAIVTGGGGALGKGISCALAKEGAIVAVADINIDGAKATVAEIEAFNGRAIAIEVDIRKWEAVYQAVAQVVENYGTVDILVNNAQAGPHNLPLEDHQNEDFLIALETGPLASWYFMSTCLPYLKKKGGRIINFRSASEYQGMVGHGAYETAKGAIQALTKNAAREWGKYGITVNCISPFSLNQNALAHFDAYPEELKKMFAGLSIPRNGEAEADIGRAVVFLAGPDASYTTGCTLSVDGGGSFL